MYCANNSGSGLLKLGGSYVTYTNTTSRDFTIVVEKFHNDGDPVCQPETVTFALGGNLAGAATHVQVWRSAFALSNGETADYFSFVGTMPVVNNTVTITVPVDTLWTISTITTASHGSHPPPPPDAPFPTTYSDDFESCAPPAEADYWSDFSCVAGHGASGGPLQLRCDVLQLCLDHLPLALQWLLGVRGDGRRDARNCHADDDTQPPGQLGGERHTETHDVLPMLLTHATASLSHCLLPA